MPSRNFLIVALIAVFGSFLVAFSGAKTQTSPTYEYVTIMQTQVFLLVTEQGKPATEELLKKDRRNLNTSYDLINRYETQGYELIETDFFADAAGQVSAFVLRRKK